MGVMREFVDRIVNAFTNTFSFDVDPSLTEDEAIDSVISDTAVVAGLVVCVQPVPLPLADLVVLTPLYAKMTLQIGKIKGFEVDQGRALDIVKEILGVIGLATVGQTMINMIGKVFPLAKLLGFALNYAATWATGKVVDYYFDCMRAGTAPSVEVMKELFAEQFRVGKKKGQAYDPSDMQRRAESLRARVASRDPELVTSTRLDPRKSRSSVSASAQPEGATGERRKITITREGLDKRSKPEEVGRGPDASTNEEQDPGSGASADEEPEGEAGGAVAKTIGPADDVPEPVEIGFKPAEKTLGHGVEVRAEPKPLRELLPDLPRAPEVSAIDANTTATSRERSDANSGASLLDRLERLASLKESGLLTDEEFLAAKRQLLADDQVS